MWNLHQILSVKLLKVLFSVCWDLIWHPLQFEMDACNCCRVTAAPCWAMRGSASWKLIVFYCGSSGYTVQELWLEPANTHYLPLLPKRRRSGSWKGTAMHIFLNDHKSELWVKSEVRWFVHLDCGISTTYCIYSKIVTGEYMNPNEIPGKRH